MESDFEELRAKHKQDIAADTLPTVDSEDLKTIWATLDNLEAHNPGAHVGFTVDQLKRVCSSGADVLAVHFRATLRRMLTEISIKEGWILAAMANQTMLCLNFLQSGKPYQNLGRF